MDPLLLILIFLIGLVGGFFDTYVGAGSLLTIPSLIFFGLPPSIAIATNRLGVIGSDISGWYKFHLKGFIDYKIALLLAIPSLLGAIIGANLLLEVNEEILKIVIAILTFIILIIIMIKPKTGIKKTQKILNPIHYFTAVFLSFIIGIYGGFYGAGAGIFLFYILILLFGQTFIQSAATRKIPNLSFSVMAAFIFVFKGVINYQWALPLFFGTLVGAYVSAHYADRIGERWIKRIFFVVVTIMVVKLIT